MKRGPGLVRQLPDRRQEMGIGRVGRIEQIDWIGSTDEDELLQPGDEGRDAGPDGAGPG